MIIYGRAWVFGDRIDTDCIVPGRFLFSPVEQAAQHAFEAVDPEFSQKVRAGDIIVAGKNFGCGSSREIAPQVIKHLGVACVLAEDMARIFFRNAIAIGLPVLTAEGISGKVQPLDPLEVFLDSCEIQNKRTGDIIHGRSLDLKMLAIIEAGGIDQILKNIKRNDYVQN